MSGEFRSIRAGVLDVVISNPQVVHKVFIYRATAINVAPLSPQILAKQWGPFGQQEVEGIFAELRRSTGREGADELAALGIDVSHLDAPLSILKSWQGIHTLLAGPDWHPRNPPANAVLGGTEIGEEGG